MPLDLTMSDLPSLAFGGSLVLCRVGVAVAVMPGLGEAGPPAMVRAGLAMGITLLVAPGQLDHAPDPSMPPLEVLAVIAREGLCGLFLGWLARLVTLALPVAGQIISLMTGLTSVMQTDPELGAQTSGIARLFSLAAPVLLLSSGLYALPLQAIADSYRLVPLGGQLSINDTTETIVRATSETFSLAFRLAAPFVIAATLWNVCLGLLSKFVPTMQTGAALLPGQVLGGMVLLALLAQALLMQWGEVANTRMLGIAAMAHG